MPQISPMSWVFIMCVLLLSFLILMSMFSKQSIQTSFSLNFLKINSKKWNW